MPTLFLDFIGTLVSAPSPIDRRRDLFLEDDAIALSQSFPLVLVTGSPRAEVDEVLRLTGLDRKITFQEIIALEEGGNQKITGAPFLPLLKKYDGPFVHVGDSDADEIGAGIAGIPCLRVRTMADEYAQRAELKRCLQEATILFRGKG